MIDGQSNYCQVAAGHDAYVVGGAVRDLLLGNPPKDFDLVTTAQPQQVSLRAGHYTAPESATTQTFFG